MKKIFYYLSLMLLVVILLPLLIVRGCGGGAAPKEGIPIKLEATKIKVYVAALDKVEEMPLEEYIKGVVAAEMPAEFEMEALKAQAVASRTYAYGRLKSIFSSSTEPDAHKGADVCSEVHCQAWISEEDAREKWGSLSFFTNWPKVEKAVSDTANVILTYQKNVVNALFHSSSSGRTENSEDVWDNVQVPYLRSVDSPGEEQLYPDFKTQVTFSLQDFCALLKKEYPDSELDEKNIAKEIKILEKTQSGRVKTLQVGELKIKGTDVRRIFSLKSTAFTIEASGEDSLAVTTLGNGHGVGMSQWGANYMARKGNNYEDILKQYYTGVELVTLGG